MKAKRKPDVVFRSRPEVVAAWLARHGLTVDQVRERQPLTAEDVDVAIGIEDPVEWAYTHLTEVSDFVGDEGIAYCRRGDPWKLAPVQARMQRLVLAHDTIFECAAEVGKTRAIAIAALHAVDTRPGVQVLITGNMELTTKAIFRMLEEQVRLCRVLGKGEIGGGLDGKPSKGSPSYEFRFRNGAVVDLRIVGAAGESLRGAHVDLLLGDEAAKYRAREVFDEAMRAVKPGGRIAFLSTPDGNFSSAFFGLCNRATPVDGRTFEERSAQTEAIADERGFKKFNIAKAELPPPFWTEARAEKLRSQFGGENSIGWQTNVLGRWGSPSYSVFPMSDLRPNLRRDLEHYRVVVAIVNREERRVRLRAARLGREEEILADDSAPLFGGRDLGGSIARWFPDTRDWKEPRLFCGIDLGSAQDPTEALFIRADGPVWTDVARVHLAGAGWEDQADVIAALDHASGHRVRYAIDRGSAGAALVEALKERESMRTCPTCAANVFFDERVTGVAFGETVSEVNPDTGSEVLDPSKRNAAGEALPYRLSAKELSTRFLERKVQAMQLRIADDAGAGDGALAAATLLTNHTSTGITSKGSRTFKGTDDHAVDARRLAALAVAAAASSGGGFVGAERVDLIASVSRGGHVSSPDFPAWGGRDRDGNRMRPASPEERRGESEGFRGFGGGGVRGGFGGDW